MEIITSVSNIFIYVHETTSLEMDISKLLKMFNTMDDTLKFYIVKLFTYFDYMCVLHFV